MAMNNFPSLNLGIEPVGQFDFGLGNGLSGMSYGSGAPQSLVSSIGVGAGGPVVGAEPAAGQGLANLFTSLFGGGNNGSSNGLFSSTSMFGGVAPNGTASGGWVSPLASIAQTAFGAIQGNKQMQLAEDRFDESRRQFDANYAAQRTTTNSQLEDRQRARVASNPGAYESVSSYMSRNQVL